MNGHEIDRGHSWTADPNWPKKYCIPYNVIYTQQCKLKVEKERGGGGVVASKVVITQRLAGYQS